MSDTTSTGSGGRSTAAGDGEKDSGLGESFTPAVAEISSSSDNLAGGLVYTFNTDEPVVYWRDYHIVVGYIQDNRYYHWNFNWQTNGQWDWDYVLKSREGFKHSSAVHKYHHHETDEQVRSGTEVRIRMDNQYWYKGGDRVKREDIWNDGRIKGMRLSLLSGFRSMFTLQDVETGEFIQSWSKPDSAFRWDHSGAAVFTAHTST